MSRHQELLKADVILISDSGMFAKGVPSVTYALRGLAYMEVEVTGPERRSAFGLLRRVGAQSDSGCWRK